MSDNDSTTETSDEQLTITLGDVPLPSDQSQRDAVLEHIQNAARQAVTEMMVGTPGNVDTVVGHQYAQIEPDCPLCGSKVNLTEIDVDVEGNGAFTTANCPDCPYFGTALFRLVDLIGPTDDPREVPDARDNEESAVTEGLVTPDYHSY